MFNLVGKDVYLLVQDKFDSFDRGLFVVPDFMVNDFLISLSKKTGSEFIVLCQGSLGKISHFIDCEECNA